MIHEGRKTAKKCLKKTLRTNRKKTQTKIRTVTYLSRKKADEEIDATDYEEEKVEFIKRRTGDAEEHMINT